MLPLESSQLMSLPLPAGRLAGFAYLVPNPELQGYTETKGEDVCATAISVPKGENLTPFPPPVGKVAGAANLVPKPGLQG